MILSPENIIEDLSGLVRTSSGKIEARPGGHDDSIMSYLIALYIYYHGNNLMAFGFYRTNEYEGSELNMGLNRPDLKEILPADVVETIERDEELQKLLNYEDDLRNAMKESQIQSRNLSKSKIMRSNNYFDQTPDEMILDADDRGDLDLSIFDQLNGF